MNGECAMSHFLKVVLQTLLKINGGIIENEMGVNKSKIGVRRSV